MYPLTLETDSRSSATAAMRGSGTNGELFAEFLRQHSDAKEPASRSRNDDARADDRRASATPAQPHRAADRRDSAAERNDSRRDSVVERNGNRRPVDDPAPRPNAEGREAVKNRAAGGSETKSKPIDEPHATGDGTIESAQPQLAMMPAASAQATTASTPAAATTAMPQTGAPQPAPAAATPAEAAADGAVPAGAAPAGAASAGATSLGAAAGGAVDTATAAATPNTGATPAGNAASPAPADAPQSDAAGNVQAADAADAAIQISRTSDTAATPAAVSQGLGKLGTGVEVALAAQAAGDGARGAGAAGDTPGAANAKKPSAGAAQQAAATTAAGGTPADGGQAAAPKGAAAGAASGAPVQQPIPAIPAAAPAIPAAAAFETTLNSAASGAEGPSGGATGAGALSGTGLHGTVGTSAAAHARPAAVHGAPAEQVGVHIQRAVRDGNSRITVQLNPVELGQVEVHLDFARDGRVSATILADRPDTLDMLQRDARLLERSLQDAGLQTDRGSLSFDLRDGGRQGFGSQAFAHRNDGHNPSTQSEVRTMTPVEQARPALTGITDSGVDIHV